VHYLRRRRIVAAGLAAAAVPGAAGADAPWPNRPLRAIVPFPPGGGTLDALARVLAPRLGAALGQPVVVDNRPGAGGNIGAEAVARAEPDGSTLLLVSTGLAAFSPNLHRTLAWKPEDFASVGLIGRSPLGFFVRTDGPADFAALAEAARRRPGQMSYGSAGNGLPSHVGMELLRRQAGLDILHVPYRGTPPVVTDLLGGRIDMALDAPPAWLGLVREGRVRMLFVTSARRWSAMPEVPTAAEAGVNDFVVENWQGLQVPAATPRERVARLSAALQSVLAEAETVRELARIGIEVWASGPAEMEAVVARERARWGVVIREAGIVAD
jgi:tripartite-type tricarboxylate transporter receptor subunit TctC